MLGGKNILKSVARRKRGSEGKEGGGGREGEGGGKEQEQQEQKHDITLLSLSVPCLS